MFKIKVEFVHFALSLTFVFSGCAVVKLVTGKGEKPTLPRVLVLGIQCDNGDIGSKIAQGLLQNITTKVESFGPNGFELLISSITRKRAGLPTKTSDRWDSGADEPPPIIQFSSSSFYQELSKSQYYRTKINLETGLDYVAIGEAKERKLSDLEEGNLITAESATITLLELRTGQIVVKDDFKQGFFEIVAPDRIGVKFSGRINKFLSGVRKQEKREAKDLQKKFEDE